MPNAMKRLSATFASSILLASSALIAGPAPAQTSGGGGSYGYNCNDPTTGGYGGYGYGCCQYDVYSGGWYVMYATHWEPCTPPYYSPEPATQDPAGPSGQ